VRFTVHFAIYLKIAKSLPQGRLTVRPPYIYERHADIHLGIWETNYLRQWGIEYRHALRNRESDPERVRRLRQEYSIYSAERQRSFYLHNPE